MRSPIVGLVLAALLVACGSESPGDPSPTAMPGDEPADSEPAADEEVANLIRDLTEGEGPSRLRAAMALRAMGKRAAAAVPALRDALLGDDPAVATISAGALGRLASEADAAMPALIEGLRSEKSRRAALAGIATAGPAARPAVPALLEILETYEGEKKKALLVIFTLIGSVGPAAEDRIASELTANDPALRAEAAWTLAEFGSARETVLSALRKATGDDDPDVAAALSFALWRGTGQAGDAVARLSRVVESGRGKTRAIRKLGEMGPAAAEAVDLLLGTLRSGDDGHRADAADALGWIGVVNDRVLAALIDALDDDGPPRDPLWLHADLAIRNLGPAAVSELRKLAESDTVTGDLRKRLNALADDIEGAAKEK